MHKRFSEVIPIIYNDIYSVRQYINYDVHYVIDIGANMGTFTMFSSILFPNAKIISYEPCEENKSYLIDNLYGFKNIKVVCEALGDGTTLYFKKVGGEISTGHMFVKEDLGSYTVVSKTLSQIFEDNKIDLSKNIILKMDCEGGESFLLDKKYDHIIKKCLHFAVEVHFRNPDRHQFDNMPEWRQYNEWIDNFKDTHTISYGNSRKKIGIGLYKLRRR